MRFITYLDRTGREVAGVVSQDGKRVRPLEETGACSMLGLIGLCSDGIPPAVREKAAGSGGVPLEELTFCAPIPHPRHDILCLGMNYHDHAVEFGDFAGGSYTAPARPTYFSKRVNRCVAHGEAIPAHADITDQLDYEVELAVVIGRRCDHVRRENAYAHVFGYTVANDVTARNLQKVHGGQFTFAKGLDGFAPMGPWIVTADEFVGAPELRLQCRVNGELRQDGNTAQLMFDIPYLIEELSAGMTLEPGDILMTGTPSGVGMSYRPPRYLRPGDTVECEIEGIGTLRNPVR